MTQNLTKMKQKRTKTLKRFDIQIYPLCPSSEGITLHFGRGFGQIHEWSRDKRKCAWAWSYCILGQIYRAILFTATYENICGYATVLSPFSNSHYKDVCDIINPQMGKFYEPVNALSSIFFNF